MKKILLLLTLSIATFIVGNNILSLTNPDEVFYAQTAREMASKHSWNVPYLFDEPQFEKPILTYWLIRIGYLLFGETGFGARFFPSFFSIIGIFSVYYFVRIGFGNERKAWLASLILMSSALYVGIGRMVFTDTIFSVWILLSLTAFIMAYKAPEKKLLGILLCCIFSALAVLTKGPLGFIIPALTIIIFLGLRRELHILRDRSFLIGMLAFCLVALPWYLCIINKYGMLFIKEFFYNDHIRRLLEAEHRSNDTWYFYPMTMFGCMFPWTLIVGGGFLYYCKSLGHNEQRANPVQQFLLIWWLVVFATFQIAHSKLVSYILPLFPVLAIMGGDFLDSQFNKATNLLRILLFCSSLLVIIIPLSFCFGLFKYSIYLPPTQEVLGFIAFYVIIISLLFVLWHRRLFIWNTYVLVAQAPIMLVIIFITHNNFETYASSDIATRYLLENYKVEGRLLCSKMFLRGTRYFTDRDVVALTISGANFFSQHPVPNLVTEAQVVTFLRSQSVTYGFVNKSSWKQLQHIAEMHNLSIELLKVIGDQYVIRLSI